MVAPGARAWGLDDVLDALFFAVAAAATCWFAVLLVAAGLHLDWDTGLRLLLFWAVLAYLALPRLHQVLTWLYVPDYFIGRTRTGDGLLGDPVNLGAWGSEEALHTAMTSAGWVRSDPVTLRSSARLISAWERRRPYPSAPVSTLTLFGRRQDVAHVKEVDANPSQRHHVRFWRVPEGWLLPGGASVDWLAAGGYDRAVGLSSLTFQITHKIDTDIDLERNYIVDDVRWAVPTAGLEVCRATSRATTRRTAARTRSTPTAPRASWTCARSTPATPRTPTPPAAATTPLAGTRGPATSSRRCSCSSSPSPCSPRRPGEGIRAAGSSSWASSPSSTSPR